MDNYKNSIKLLDNLQYKDFNKIIIYFMYDVIKLQFFKFSAIL